MLETGVTDPLHLLQCTIESAVPRWPGGGFGHESLLPCVTNYSTQSGFAMQMRALVEMDNSGLVVLLEQDQYDDLARMYSLFKRLDDGLNLIRKIMGEHLKSAGSALVQNPESTKDPVDFVQRLLAMKDKYDRCT